MSIVDRWRRYRNMVNPLRDVVLIVIFVSLAYRYRAILFEIPLILGAIAVFVLPYFFRSWWIPRRYVWLEMILIIIGSPMVIAVCAGPQHVPSPYFSISVHLFLLYMTFLLALHFWCVSDPMYEMVTWLTLPTELGKLPDEIALYDHRAVTFIKGLAPYDCWLYRIRDGQNWYYGLVGPVTICLFDQDYKSDSPEDIYDAYIAWFPGSDLLEIVEDLSQQGYGPDEITEELARQGYEVEINDDERRDANH